MELLLIRHALPVRRELETGVADPELAAEIMAVGDIEQLLLEAAAG